LKGATVIRTILKSTLLISIAAVGARSADNPVGAQFDRLMKEPKDLATCLTNFPWKDPAMQQLFGFHEAPPPEKLRIVSALVTPRPQPKWRHWESEDGAAWIDLLTFSEPSGASDALSRSHQPHSGYEWDNQHLLFSGTGNLQKEAVGAAIVQGRRLLNLGMKLPLEVHWDRPLPEADRIAFDAALTRFQGMLEMVARSALDPTYVSLEKKITPKPEALRMLRITGFTRLWSTIKYNFVYMDRRPELNWDAVLDEYMPRIAAAKDDVEYGRILERVVALLHDGHTGVYPTSAAPQDAPAIFLEPIEGKPVATAIGNLPELSAIKPGMELAEIDGVPSSTIIERDLDPYIFSSTIQDRRLRQMRMLMGGVPGSQMRTKWIAPDGTAVEATLTRNGRENRGVLKYPGPTGRFAQKDLPGGIAYVQLNTFADAAIDKDFESKFDQLREAKAWIIDLRYNGGGSSDIGGRILAHFIDAPLKDSIWRTRQYNPTWEAWGKAQQYFEGEADYIQPASGPHYAGPVYVLTSPSTCSAAEDFLIPLKMAKRVTIVGEPTCGSTGQPLLFSIYGATGRVCTKEDRYPDGTLFVGVGVVPDVPAARTKKDVVESRDAVLEKAIALATAALK
jgi:C-terminal processing protease CtpA/Prc